MTTTVNPTVAGTNPDDLRRMMTGFESIVPGIGPHLERMLASQGAPVGPTTAARSVDALADRRVRFGFNNAAPGAATGGPDVDMPLSERERGQRARTVSRTAGVAPTVATTPDQQARFVGAHRNDRLTAANGRTLTIGELHDETRTATEQSLVASGRIPAAGPGRTQAHNDLLRDETDLALQASGVHRVVAADGSLTDRFAVSRIDPATRNSRISPDSQRELDALTAARAAPATPGATPGAAAPGTLDAVLRNSGIPGMGTGAMGTMGLGLGTLSMTSVGLGAAESMAFQMRKQMRSTASNFGDYSMIALINSPGIPIESLIYYFMAYMSDKYEDKLREKMEEVVIQEQRERRMEQRRQAGELIGGLVGLGMSGGNPLTMAFSPLAGLSSSVGRMVADGFNSIEGALAGSSKSTTVLMQEVQILIQNWKMIMDMTSNVSKTLHEMAMTAVRNIR